VVDVAEVDRRRGLHRSEELRDVPGVREPGAEVREQRELRIRLQRIREARRVLVLPAERKLATEEEPLEHRARDVDGVALAVAVLVAVIGWPRDELLGLGVLDSRERELLRQRRR